MRTLALFLEESFNKGIKVSIPETNVGYVALSGHH